MLRAAALFALLVALPAAGAETDLLPAPTGPHKTGRQSFHWQDTARDELETAAPDDKRELMVHLFYPADPTARNPRADYVPDADAMRGLWTPEQLARITAIRAYSLEGAPPPPGDARYPVLICSPGGGMKGLTYHALCEDLASHGWIVAAIDPPYNARAVRLPDGRVLGNLRPAERGWQEPKSQEEAIRNYRQRVAHWARDIRFVIDQLAALDQGDGPLAGRLDLQRGVGVFGHSRGGQAAGTVRILDPRVRGGANLDGAMGDVAVQPLEGHEGAGSQPFLWLQKAFPVPTDEELKRAGRTRAEIDAMIEKFIASWHAQLETMSDGALRVVIDRPNLDHIDFSDEPFWDGHTTEESRPGKLQTIADTRTWLRAFFTGAVLGDWTALNQLAASRQPDVTVHAFGALRPK